MLSEIAFVLDDRVVSLNFREADRITPTTTLLNFLRSLPNHKGVKEGCAQGDCGACTVVLGEPDEFGRMCYKAINSCLVFLPMVHGKQVITVENLRTASGDLHPVQRAFVYAYGSQCGYCTPGFVMSLFALYKKGDGASREEIEEAIVGNLCRCTGYQPIVEAAQRSCSTPQPDHFAEREAEVVQLLRSIPSESIQIRTPQQLYFRPRTLEEAIKLRREFSGATLTCGATDVALRVTRNHEVLAEVIDLSAVEQLKSITENSSSLTVGAGATLCEIEKRAKRNFPALRDMLAVFGSAQIRNLATLGGNLATASPVGDSLPVLMAYGARVVLEGLDGRRELTVEDFITGYRRTALRPDEIIAAVVIPKLSNDTTVRWYKLSKRKDVDIATVSAAFRLMLDSNGTVHSIMLVYGGMADRPKRAETLEHYLVGKLWEYDTVDEAGDLLEKEFSPISDVRGSAEFRMIAAKNLLKKFWLDTRTATS